MTQRSVQWAFDAVKKHGTHEVVSDDRYEDGEEHFMEVWTYSKGGYAILAVNCRWKWAGNSGSREMFHVLSRQGSFCRVEKKHHGGSLALDWFEFGPNTFENVLSLGILDDFEAPR